MTSNSDSAPPPPSPPPPPPVPPKRDLARQEAEFTAEGAPAPGQVGGTERPALPDPVPGAAPPAAAPVAPEAAPAPPVPPRPPRPAG